MMTNFAKYNLWRRAKRSVAQESLIIDNVSPESNDDNFPQENDYDIPSDDGLEQNHFNDDNFDHSDNENDDGLDHQPPSDPDDDPSENGNDVVFEGDEVPENTSLSLLEVIAEWTINERIRKTKVDTLLKLLYQNKHIRKMTRAKTLLKTPKSLTTQVISDLETYTYNVSHQLQILIKRLDKYTGGTNHDIYVIYNLDGVPLAKSSNYQFWPLLCRSV